MCCGLMIHCMVTLNAVLESAYQWREEGKYISRTVLRTGYYFGTFDFVTVTEQS